MSLRHDDETLLADIKAKWEKFRDEIGRDAKWFHTYHAAFDVSAWLEQADDEAFTAFHDAERSIDGYDYRPLERATEDEKWADYRRGK